MTDLDTLARDATKELLERSAPDVRSRYADLRRTRTRRATAKLTAAGAVLAVAVGGWQLAGPRNESVEPAPQPSTIRNGSLLALPAAEVGPRARWSTIRGEAPAHLPSDGSVFSQWQFTAEGTEIVYADRRARISAVDVETGSTRTLADCPDDICAGAVSPDFGSVAVSDGDVVRVMTVGNGEVHVLPGTDVGATGAPAWSPDGRSLAFVGAGGVYVADLDSEAVRLVTPAGTEVSGPVDWSPDGRSLAYFETRPARRPRYDTSFTATVLDLASGVAAPLLEAGHCGCGGLAPPTLIWSPDGKTVAVATTHEAAVPWGVYLVPLDGGEPERVVGGSYAALAWQPLRG